MKLLMLLLASLWLAATARAEDRALLVGVDDYRSERVRPLVGSRNDVLRMQALLRDTLGFQDEQIRVLLDDQATREAVLRELEQWLVQGTGADDRVVFYFTGHGEQVPDRDGDEADGLDEAIAGVDTRIDADGSIHDMILDDELAAVFDRLLDRDVTVIIDACHSGTITRSLRADAGPGALALPKTLRLEPTTPAVPASARAGDRTFAVRRRETGLLEAAPRRVVWTAVSPAQDAFVDTFDQPPGGVFTSAFVAGLGEGRADRNGNGRISHAELLAFLRAESARFCARLPGSCALGLTPTLEARKDLRIEPVLDHGRPVPGAVADTAAWIDDALPAGNEAGIELELLPATTLRLGQTLRLRVSSERAGRLLLLDVNAAGELTQLFPNRYSDRAGQGDRIEAGQRIVIPNSYYGFELTAVEPTGSGRLIAVVSEDPVPLDALLVRHKTLLPIDPPRPYVDALAEGLQDTWTGDATDRPRRWSRTTLDYRIID